MTIEAMIDIESFGTANTAVVFQIGAIVFDGDKILESMCIDLDVQEQLNLGRTVSASTLNFWVDPDISGVAYKSLSGPSKSVSGGLSMVRKIMHSLNGIEQVWAKGSFDFNVLESLFDVETWGYPWEFRQLRDLRTLMKECGVPKHENITHNALDDCINQHKQLMECRRVIQLATFKR